METSVYLFIKYVKKSALNLRIATNYKRIHTDASSCDYNFTNPYIFMDNVLNRKHVYRANKVLESTPESIVALHGIIQAGVVQHIPYTFSVIT